MLLQKRNQFVLKNAYKLKNVKSSVKLKGLKPL
jgi:hypothetical protein